ncbi:MAG: hypothetical protein HY862_09700 [Chloroflexi bacterium]|nr:hypothetical protein [Chloroflexota bacterium]
MRRTILLCGLILAFILAACGGDDDKGRQPTATSSAPQIKVVVSQAPVFTLPNRTAEIIVNLFEGETRHVLGKSAPDEVGTSYFQIDLGNRTGWILESQVQLTGDSSKIALVEAATATATSTPTATAETPTQLTTETTPTQSSTDVTAAVIVARATVLTAPSREADELTTLLQGEQVKVLRQTLPDALGTIFYEVELGTQRGWVLGSQVEISGDVSTLGIAFVPTASPEVVAQGATSAPTTIVPTATATPTATETRVIRLTAEPTTSTANDVTPSPSPVIANDNPSIQVGETPPLTMTLPDGWDAGHFLIPVSGSIGQGNVKMSVYEGPLPDGMKGTIWIVWGFPPIINPYETNPNGTLQISLWPDGIQYLRGLLFKDCNIGLYTDNRQNYDMGGYEGEGTTFSAVNCEGASDISGWWVGVHVNDENFIFYMGVEPVDRVAEGLSPMQAIIDTLHFVSE